MGVIPVVRPIVVVIVLLGVLVFPLVILIVLSVRLTLILLVLFEGVPVAFLLLLVIFPWLRRNFQSGYVEIRKLVFLGGFDDFFVSSVHHGLDVFQRDGFEVVSGRVSKLYRP